MSARKKTAKPHGKHPEEPPGKSVSDDDMALFREAVGDVRSVEHDRIDTPKPSASPVIRHSEHDDRSVMQSLLEDLSESDFLETGEHLSYTQAGVQRGVLKKLKSGRYSVQSEIDLHGLKVEEARLELSEFLKAARERRHLCVRIIHGKGRKNAAQGPRLKPAVNQWLQRNKSVLAFCSARMNDGGTGAVYVLLKRMGE
ncbi:MAG: Smr/MutS family protein [Granulosicoccus sp.]